MPNPAPALLRVLCATDLSEFGNRALPLAFAATAPAGRVTALHVLQTKALPSPLVPHYGEPRPSEEELAAQGKECTAALDAAARPLAAERGVAYEVRVVRAARVAEAILAEAARIDAELICLTTRCRSGLTQFVLGSGAEEVLCRAGRPVLLIPPTAGK